jgi:hypothetical protein
VPQDPHRISLHDAIALVQRAQVAPPRLVKGWSIDTAIIREILDQPGATRLRIYLGAKDDGEATLVFLGIDGADKDMTGGTIAEWALPCPPLCDSSSQFLTG